LARPERRRRPGNLKSREASASVDTSWVDHRGTASVDCVHRADHEVRHQVRRDLRYRDNYRRGRLLATRGYTDERVKVDSPFADECYFSLKLIFPRRLGPCGRPGEPMDALLLSQHRPKVAPGADAIISASVSSGARGVACAHFVCTTA
jgi:hypothetical protein